MYPEKQNPDKPRVIKGSYTELEEWDNLDKIQKRIKELEHDLASLKNRNILLRYSEKKMINMKTELAQLRLKELIARQIMTEGRETR